MCILTPPIDHMHNIVSFHRCFAHWNGVRFSSWVRGNFYWSGDRNKVIFQVLVVTLIMNRMIISPGGIWRCISIEVKCGSYYVPAGNSRRQSHLQRESKCQGGLQTVFFFPSLSLAEKDLWKRSVLELILWTQGRQAGWGFNMGSGCSIYYGNR